MRTRRALQWAIPFVFQLAALSHLRLTNGSEHHRMVREETVRLRSLFGDDRQAAEICAGAVSEVVAGASGAASSLESKAIGLLGALAVLVGAVVAVAVVAWTSLHAWQQVLFFLSGLYSGAAFVYALAALAPRTTYVLTPEGLDGLFATRREDTLLALAAIQLANSRANQNRNVRLTNLVVVARNCALIAFLLASVSLAALAVSNFRW